MKPAYHTLIHRKANKKARFRRSQSRWDKRCEKMKAELLKDFKIIECTAEKIIVSREPQNEEDITKMISAAQDAIVREWLNHCGREVKWGG